MKGTAARRIEAEHGQHAVDVRIQKHRPNWRTAAALYVRHGTCQPAPRPAIALAHPCSPGFQKAGAGRPGRAWRSAPRKIAVGTKKYVQNYLWNCG